MMKDNRNRLHDILKTLNDVPYTKRPKMILNALSTNDKELVTYLSLMDLNISVSPYTSHENGVKKGFAYIVRDHTGQIILHIPLDDLSKTDLYELLENKTAYVKNVGATTKDIDKFIYNSLKSLLKMMYIAKINPEMHSLLDNLRICDKKSFANRLNQYTLKDLRYDLASKDKQKGIEKAFKKVVTKNKRKFYSIRKLHNALISIKD